MTFKKGMLIKKINSQFIDEPIIVYNVAIPAGNLGHLRLVNRDDLYLVVRTHTLEPDLSVKTTLIYDIKDGSTFELDVKDINYFEELKLDS